MAAVELMTDRDVCRILHISKWTLCRKLNPGYKCKPGEIDLRKARPAVIGHTRYWLTNDFNKVMRREIT